MRLRTSLFAVVASLALVVTGCDNPDNYGLAHRGDQFGDIYFSGYVYDGITGARLTGYKIDLQYSSTTRHGRVDRDGRYSIGGLPQDQDFTIVISADGYRAFESHNGMYNFEPFDWEFADGKKSYIFMAYLYPEATQAPATEVHVAYANQASPVASGTVRLRPSSQSSLIDNEDTPAGVSSQVWRNDEDLLAAVVNGTIANGVVSFPAGALVYGVEYDVDVFGVQGYQIAEDYTLIAGEDAFIDVVVSPLDTTDLQIVYHNADTILPQSGNAGTYSLTVVFNRPIAFSPEFIAGHYVDAVDAAGATTMSFVNGSPTLKTATMGNDVAERGITVTIAGNTLTLSMSRSGIVQTDVANAKVATVVFGALDQVLVIPAGSTDSTLVTSVSNASYVNGFDLGTSATLNVDSLP